MSVESLSAACAGSHSAVGSDDVIGSTCACPIGRDARHCETMVQFLYDSIDHANLYGDWMMLGSHFS